MKNIVSLICLLVVVIPIWGDNTITLTGRVKDNITKKDLNKAMVLTFDSKGNIIDTIPANQGISWSDNIIDTLAFYRKDVPRRDSIFIFEVICDGYQPKRFSYKLSKIKSREYYRELPVTFLNLETVTTLAEVTVTQSKIKFYNKGDTLVFNASAFQLAEGSMLDALIAQLPGVELSNNGQIKVNGQFVESLLLNGREFLDGDNNLMLENIAAYTVKDIQVYEGERDIDKMMGNIPHKVLTMNVQMKKNYQIGWIVNGQGGYGTNDRYLGRLFAAWFNPEWNIAFAGNLNNLNDNRTPGRTDSWTPDLMPSGRKEFRDLGFNYSFRKANDKTRLYGTLLFRQLINKTESSVSRTNFLSGGDTYERNFNNSNDKSISIQTSHSFYQKISNVAAGMRIGGNFDKVNSSFTGLSGSFSVPQDSMTYKVLDAIYSDAGAEALESILNRAKTQTDNSNHTLFASLTPYVSYKLPKTGDNLSFNFTLQHRRTKEDLWQDYDITFGPTAYKRDILRQYFDNNPYRKTDFFSILTYGARFKDIYLGLSYKFGYTNEIKDSYMYELDKLNDIGVYGVLPADYMASFDPENSYTSHQWAYSHQINPNFQAWITRGNDAAISLRINPTVVFYYQKFAYCRNNVDYSLKTHYTYVDMANFNNSEISFLFNKKGEGQNASWRNELSYKYEVASTLPNLFDKVDVVNDADPLNIYIGNPDLKVSVRNQHHFEWNYSPATYRFYNQLSYDYSYTDNALTRGYTYDVSTGIRVNKMYNVKGNRWYGFSDYTNWQFGSTGQFILSNSVSRRDEWLTDMIGLNLSEPSLNRVRNKVWTDNFKINWQIGTQNVGLRCDISNRRTTSSQTGFNNLNAIHVNVGFQGIFKLPAGFGISTDFTCYTRRGYGVPTLDTTDPIWNIRASYAPPRNSHWVFTLDGFDMLHQLSNVNYAVTAAGRTVTYTNALPRYFIFTVQYRLNLQPKKR